MRNGPIDLGNGHAAYWIINPDDGKPIGLDEFHSDYNPEIHGCANGGYIAWAVTSYTFVVNHALIAGDPEHPELLEISPSLFHRHRHTIECQENCKINSPTGTLCHGFIQRGVWVGV